MVLRDTKQAHLGAAMQDCLAPVCQAGDFELNRLQRLNSRILKYLGTAMSLVRTKICTRDCTSNHHPGLRVQEQAENCAWQ